VAYTPPSLTETITLACDYTPPPISDPVTLCPQVASQGYTPPPLSQAVILECDYTPPAISQLVELTCTGEQLYTGDGYATLPGIQLAALINATGQRVAGESWSVALPGLGLSAAVSALVERVAPVTSSATLPPPSAITQTAAWVDGTMVQPASAGVSLAPPRAPAPIPTVEGEQDLALWAIVGSGASWNLRTGGAASRPVRCDHAGGERLADPVEFKQTQAARLTRKLAVHHAHGSRRWRVLRAPLQQGERIQIGLDFAARHGDRLRQTLVVPTQQATRLEVWSGWQIHAGTRLVIPSYLPLQQAQRDHLSLGWGLSTGRPLWRPVEHPLQQAMWPLAGFWVPGYVPPPLSSAVILECPPNGYCARPLSCMVVLCSTVQPDCPEWICDGQPVNPWPAETYVIPWLRTYYMLHTVTIARDGVPLDFERIEAGLDKVSHTWTFRITLLGRAALDAIQPDAQGNPVILDIDVNGWQAQALVDDWSEDVQFGRRAISINARGLTAELAAPWLLAGSGTNALGDVQQVLAALLPLDSGFNLEWGLLSDPMPWSVPADAWSWQGQTPIEAIHAAAQGVGLRLDPDPNARTLTLTPHYPVTPWEQELADPDLVVPVASILNYRRRYTPPTQANAVYVHGTDTGGITGYVRRTGSAGDRLAQTAQHPLITHTDAARVLGTRLLAAQHQQPSWQTLTLPVGGVYPIAQIGQLVHLDAGDDSDRGTVTAWRLQVATKGDGAVTVRQTLTLGEDVPNIWARWRALAPGSPTLLGEVLASSDGLSTVELLGGGQVRVRGSATVGAQVWIRDGQIQGAAPALPGYEIEV